MQKIFVITFCTLLLCVLLLTIGINMVVAQDYERNSYITQVTPTIDGQWTSPDEWTDGEETWIGTDVVFRSTWNSEKTSWIVEFLTDTTNNPSDLWQFCMNLGQTFSWKFEITGHTELAWFLGTDGDWTEFPEGFTIEWANSLSTSSASSTPHWILEFQIDREGQFDIPEVWHFFLQAIDASGPTVRAWPPNADEATSADYGTENSLPEAIPEGLTFAVMALLTTVSMLVGYRYFIKRKETKTQ